LITNKNCFDSYLENTELCDFTNHQIVKICIELFDKSSSEKELVKRIYEYVRDDIKHTADTNKKNVTCSASEVILYKHGICCAKANLFATFLRYFNIPVGFCYQKIKSNTKNGFALHGLNAVYFKEHEKWIRLDVGGVKSDSDAKFSIEEENLVYRVNQSMGEIDHQTIFDKPNHTVIEVLQNSAKREDLWKCWSLTLDAVFGAENKEIELDSDESTLKHK